MGLALIVICALAFAPASLAEPVKPIGHFAVHLRSGADANELAHSQSAVTQASHRAPPRAPQRNPKHAQTLQRSDLQPQILPNVPDESKVNVRDVFWMTTVMAAACGLGAIPFFFIEKLSKVWAAMANAIACGVMIAASFDLLHEAEGYGPAPLILGLVFGCLFIKHMQDWLEGYEDVKFQDLRGADAHKIMLFVGIMAAHAIGEGSGVGVSFCGRRGWAHGLLVTLAIGIHNIPEGLAVATVLVSRGTTPRKALEWTLLCALPQPLFAVPSFIFVDSFKALLPVSMGFAAGCMLWIVVAELLPDALEDMDAGAVASAVTLSATVLEGMRVMLAGLEQPNGSLSATLSGNLPTILHASAAAATAAVAAAVVVATASMALPGTRGGPSFGAPSTQAAVAAGVLLVSAASGTVTLVRGTGQSLLATAALAAVGAALVWGLHRHQSQMLRESMKRGRNGGLPTHMHDVEAGGADGSRVRPLSPSDSWDVVSTASAQDHLHGGHPALPASYGAAASPPMLDYVKEKAMRSSAGRSTISQLASSAPVAALMCLLTLLGLAVVQGWKYAYMVAAQPEATFSPLTLLAFLWAVPACAAAAGLAPQVGIQGLWKVMAIALMPGVTMAVTAMFSMLMYPTGAGSVDELPYDPSDWMSKATAVVVGASLMSVGWALWPQLRRSSPSAAYRGSILGLVVSGSCMALLKATCGGSGLCA